MRPTPAHLLGPSRGHRPADVDHPEDTAPVPEEPDRDLDDDLDDDLHDDLDDQPDRDPDDFTGDPTEAPGDGSAGTRKGAAGGRRGTVEWLVVIAGAIVVALVVQALLVQAFWIPSESMEHTLVRNDRVLVEKVGYRFHEPNPGDVVVFRRDAADLRPGDPDVLIKRVIGRPGDSIVIDASAGGKVEVNGQELVEPYLDPAVSSTNTGPVACTSAQPCVVPEGHLWLMGDNRPLSRDSRYLGFVPIDHVIGRAFVLVWPFTRLSGL